MAIAQVQPAPTRKIEILRDRNIDRSQSLNRDRGHVANPGEPRSKAEDDWCGLFL